MRSVFLVLVALVAFSAQMAAQERHYSRQLIELAVFSSDGKRLGTLRMAFKQERGIPDNSATIVFNSGGFLGIGGRQIAIPGGKWVQSGKTVVLGMTADDVAKLPTYEPQPTCECVCKQ